MNIIKRGEANFIHWFQRHLNLTWVMSLVVVMGSLGLWVVRSEGVGGLEATLLGLAQLVVSERVISEKGRSLWWLLLAPVFSPLWLTNKKTGVVNKQKGEPKYE